MQIHCQPDPELSGVLVVRPTGALDARGAARFWDAVGQRVGENAAHVLVDMSGIEYLSSAGIGVLIRLLQRTGSHGGTVVLHGLADKVRKVLRICELDEVLHAATTAEEARGYLRQWSPSQGTSGVPPSL